MDWTKKVNKGCSDALQPGETFVAATYVEPPGVIGRTVAFGAVGGAIGMAAGHKMAKKKEAEAEAMGSSLGVADQFPKTKTVLAVTEGRLLAFKHSALSGKPKELLFEVPRPQIAASTYSKGKLLTKLQLTFADGSAIAFEGAKAGKPEKLAEALGAVET